MTHEQFIGERQTLSTHSRATPVKYITLIAVKLYETVFSCGSLKKKNPLEKDFSYEQLLNEICAYDNRELFPC